jgi:arabinogalactan oligomer/maltooligosaccharide transport system permease protein
MVVGGRDPRGLRRQGLVLAVLGSGFGAGAFLAPWHQGVSLPGSAARRLALVLGERPAAALLVVLELGLLAAALRLALGRRPPRWLSAGCLGLIAAWQLGVGLVEWEVFRASPPGWGRFLMLPAQVLLLAAATRFARAAQRELLFENLLTHLFLVVFCLLTLYPVMWVVKIALGPNKGLSISLRLLPESPSLANFRHVLFEKPFFTWLANSAVIAAGTTVLGIFLATTAAYAFSRFRFPGRTTGLMSFLITQMFPGTMMMIPLYLIVDMLGLLDRILGLIVVYSTTSIPFCVWMLKGYFDTIPRDLEEAALIDGASRTTIFYRIIVPLAKPAIAVTALFAFMTGWNEFILAATFMSKGSSWTLPVGLQYFVGQFAQDWGYFAAGAILVSIPVVVLFFLLQPYLVSGLTAGSVKG